MKSKPFRHNPKHSLNPIITTTGSGSCTGPITSGLSIVLPDSHITLALNIMSELNDSHVEWSGEVRKAEDELRLAAIAVLLGSMKGSK